MLNADGRRQLHKDDRGAALAMVIVIIAFIAILAAVLMFVAYAGFRMRIVDKQGKDNFYTAETVLDEINVGLQGEISAALAAAYEDIMINYSLETSSSARNQRFRDKYFEKLQESLQTDSTHYNIAKLRGYLSNESRGDVAHGADGSRQSFVDGASYGAIVESDIGVDDADPVSFMMEANNTRLLLKDLRVSYVNENGYVSIISTDIRIDLPSFNFSQAAALPALDSCVLLADDTLFIGNKTAGGNITVKGDTYAGQLIVGKPDGMIPSALNGGNPVTDGTVEPSVSDLLATAINFENLAGDDAVGMSLIVSRNGIDVGEGSSFNTKGTDIWAQNFTLNSADAQLDGSVNLKDDLTLAGKNSTAVLKGEYTGFGYLVASSDTGGDDENDSSGDSEEDTNPFSSPDASSAIVINGRGSTLDLSGLQRMTISGRAYVATAYNSKTDPNPDGTSDQVKGNKANVMMGESVAVKSNQLIYLVPSEALGCRIEKDGSISDSEYNCNPLTLEQYEDIITHPEKYVLINGGKELASLGYRRLSDYINQEQVAGGESAYVPEIIFSQTNAGTLVYCYLRFPDESAANRYFRDYYGVNAESVDRYTRLYADDIKMADELLYLNMAGNMLAYEGEDTWSVVGAEESSGNIKQAKRISANKNEEFNSLRVKLVRTANLLTDAELGRTAFPNIIDELEVLNVLDAKGASEVQINTQSNTEAMVLTKRDEYIVDNSTPDAVKVIVSLGNVTVKRSFTGLIIAKGNITVAAESQITLEPLDVNTFSNILFTAVGELSKESGHEHDYYLMNVFADGLSYAYSGNVAFDEGTSRVSMVDLISYERWTKK